MIPVMARHYSSVQIAPFCPNPLKWIASKIQLLIQKFFGYFLRLSVFQLGEYKRPLSYAMMRLYQILNCDPRDEKPVSHERLTLSMNLLMQFGGVETVVVPEDGKAEVRLMTFKASEFLRRIEQMGGQKIPIVLRDENGQPQNRFAIVPAVGISHEQFGALITKLKKFSLSSIDIGINNAVQKAILLPENPPIPPDQTTPMIIRFHSPGRSMAMDRKFIGLHLGAGYDICIFDPRGTIDSQGVPSEGGYYLDSDAVYKHVRNLGYPAGRIYLSGYCKGGATAAYLKQKYHAEGVHFIAENPFNALVDLAKNQNFVGHYFAEKAMPEIISDDPSITRLVPQDGFNLEKKFQNLPLSNGKFILIPTDNDKIVPPHSVQKIRQAIGQSGPYFEIMRNHPNPKANGHMQPPIEDPKVWHRYVQVVV